MEHIQNASQNRHRSQCADRWEQGKKCSQKETNAEFNESRQLYTTGSSCLYYTRSGCQFQRVVFTHRIAATGLVLQFKFCDQSYHLLHQYQRTVQWSKDNVQNQRLIRGNHKERNIYYTTFVFSLSLFSLTFCVFLKNSIDLWQAYDASNRLSLNRSHLNNKEHDV